MICRKRCPGSPPRHHFIVEPPNGTPHVTGACKLCGVKRRMRASITYPNPWVGHHRKKSSS